MIGDFETAVRALRVWAVMEPFPRARRQRSTTMRAHEVASKTSNVAGDVNTTKTLLTYTIVKKGTKAVRPV